MSRLTEKIAKRLVNHSGYNVSYDNRLDFFALRLLSRINDPNAIYDDASESDYCGDYLDDDVPEQVPYPLRILDEAEEDSNGLPNLRLVEESDEEERVIPGEEDDPFEPEESKEGPDEDSGFRKAA